MQNGFDDIPIIVGETTDAIVLTEHKHAWRTRAFNYQQIGQQQNQSLSLAVAETTLSDAHEHCITTTNEIGGVLIGQVYRSQGRLAVQIDALLPAAATNTSPVHITFDVETWIALYNRSQRLYPDQMIVGWYHSHPYMDVGFSQTDIFMHREYFNSAWNVALVMNGQDRIGRFYVWDEDQLVPSAGFYIFRGRGQAPRLRLDFQQGRFKYHSTRISHNADQLVAK